MSDTEFTPEFLSRLRDGEAAAFRQVYEQYSDMVYNVCLRMIGNQEDAEDATQEVFLKVHRSVADFRGEAQLSSWIYRIAVNTCLNRERRKKWARWVSLDFLFTPEGEEHAGSEDSADQFLEEKERVRAVRQAIRSIPQSQKTAIILQRYENLSYQEIADIMGKSLSAVESLLHRAKQNLVKNLREFEHLYI